MRSLSEDLCLLFSLGSVFVCVRNIQSGITPERFFLTTILVASLFVLGPTAIDVDLEEGEVIFVGHP